MRKYRHKRRSNSPLSKAKRFHRRVWVALTHIILAPAFAFYVGFCLFNIAQVSAPEVPFYGLKLAIEDARLGLTTDPAQHASLALTFAAERVHEIVQIANRDQEIPESVLLRLQGQLRMALQDATNATEQDRQHILTEMNDVTKHLQDTLTQAEPAAPIATRDAMRRAFRLVEQTHLQAEKALSD